MSFKKVIFTGSTTFNNTSIYSPSKAFDLSFMGSIDNIHVDAQCHVTAFSYYDRANFTLEKWMQRKKLKFSNSNKIADTYLHWTKYGPQIIFEKKTTAMQIFITKEKSRDS